MKNRYCLNEQDLILHYYGEQPENNEQARHLADCRLCGQRLAALSHDLGKLPGLNHEPDAAAATRMAARVSEQLATRRSNWLPVLGASTIAAMALLITIASWSPPEQRRLTVQAQAPELATLSLDEDMPEIDFLEDLEVLQELELLSQIEGV